MILPTAKTAQPSLADLTARFLARPTSDDVNLGVEPHEVTAGFATDARTAWLEAIAAANLLGVKDFPTNTPSDWAGYVRQSPGVDFLPLALGHFPQQVRDINSLIGSPKKSAASESRSWSVSMAKQSHGNLLLNAAAARVSGNFTEAQRLLLDAKALGQDATLQLNEQAALHWQKGEKPAAIAIWNQMPVSGVTAFNLGLAALTLGQKAEAKAHFLTAVAKLPEASGWQHLAQLYLALV